MELATPVVVPADTTVSLDTTWSVRSTPHRKRAGIMHETAMRAVSSFGDSVTNRYNERHRTFARVAKQI